MVDNKEFQWSRILSLLSTKMSDLDFDSWIEPLKFSHVESNTIYLIAPSRFIKNWVLKTYSNTILELLSNYNITNINIDTVAHVVQETPKTTDNISSSQTTSQLKSKHIGKSVAKFIPSEHSSLGLPLNPLYTFDNFVVGKPNEFIYTAAKRVAVDKNSGFNPLFIYGGVGLGKTHIMHAIAWEIQKNKDKRNVLYITTEKFVSLFIRALREKNIFQFKDTFRSVDVLMIDDFQFISNKEQTQEELFHTFNSLMSQGAQIIITADKPPSEIGNIEERIVSRIQAGLNLNIQSTTYELRVGILQSKAKILNVRIPKDVIDFLAHTITSNIRELEGALRKIVSYHQLMRTPIDLNMTLTILEDVLKYKNKPIEIDLIQKKVAEHYKVKLVDITATKRDKDTSFARHIAMYIAKNLTNLPLSEIGRKFGGRDHTTVLYSINKISKLIKTDKLLADDINLLISIIQKS